MYIGKLNTPSPKFYHANTTVPFAPETKVEGFLWSSGAIFDTEVDAVYNLGKEYYVGEVELIGLSGEGELSILVDGIKIAVKDKTSPVHVNSVGHEVVIRIRGSVADLRFGGISIFGFDPEDEEPFLLPNPKNIKAEKKRVKIGSFSSPSVDGMFAVDFLTESLEERYEGLPGGDGIDLSFNISQSMEAESYTVSVTESEATVTAGSRLALLWGACRVIELWQDATLPLARIEDKPDVPMRGFHMGLPTRENFDFFKKLIRYALLPHGYNHVILEFNGDMRYDRHPEITECWLESERLYREGKGKRVMHADIGAEGTALEKSEVRELVEAIERYGIEVIPEVQSLSHIEYITNAHPEFAELGKHLKEECNLDLDNLREESYVPEIPAENIAGIHHANIFDHCYCPADERCMAIVRDIIDEVVEVVKPRRYVHIGHDEVYHLGLCPACREKGAPAVYVEHVKALHGYLREKGLGTMLWSDMLHTDMYYTGEAFDNVRRELPKDLMLLDFTWYYHFDKDIEDFLLPEGYKIMMGNLYSSHYPRFSSRIKKDGMVGGEVSTWTGVSEKLFALNGKFFDLPYTGEMLWNAYTYDERNRQSLTALIGQLVIPEMRDLMHGRYDLYLATDMESADYAAFGGSARRVPTELRHLRLVEPEGKIKVGKRYDRLIFSHATLNPAPRICWQPLVSVGKYTVTYKDGESVDIPVDYAGGILHTGAIFGLPNPQQYYRHQGYVGTWFADPTYEHRTAEGKPILLLGQVWDNPRPEKKIAYVTYTPDKDDYAVLLSAGVLGVKIK